MDALYARQGWPYFTTNLFFAAPKVFAQRDRTDVGQWFDIDSEKELVDIITTYTNGATGTPTT